MNRTLWCANLILLSLLLPSCSNKEADALSVAQNCLDQIPSDDGSNALTCIEPIASFDSQGANIIRCSAYFLNGGLTTQRIIDAYKKLQKKDEEKKEILFISLLALNDLETAENADRFCQRTGLASYTYLSNLAVIGTSLQAAFGANFSDLSEDDLKLAVEQTLEGCQGNGSDTELIERCRDQAESIAGSAVTLSESYCTTEKRKEEKVCQDIQGAITGADGSNEQITASLLCLLDKKTYSNGTCS